MQTKTRYLSQFLESLGIEATEKKEVKKRRMTLNNLAWLINKTAQMFEYENLPDTITRLSLERILQSYGSVAILRVPDEYKPRGYGPSFHYSSEYKSNIYAMRFSFAEAPDPYDEPYQIIVTNPGFIPSLSQILTINKDAVIIRNDTNYQGLYQLHYKYAELLTEAELSLQSTLVLLRDQMTFIVKNEAQRAAVVAYIKARENGDYASIMAPSMGSPLEVVNHDGRSNAVELAVNGIQAIKSAWYNEIGLNPSFSLKREYTSAQEIDTNTDLLLPIIDDMYEQRKAGIEAVNDLFGTYITVKKSSAWHIKDEEINLSLKTEEAELHEVENGNNERLQIVANGEEEEAND